MVIQQTIETRLKGWLEKIRKAIPLQKCMEMLSIDFPGNIRLIEGQISEAKRSLKEDKNALEDFVQDIEYRVQSENPKLSGEKKKTLAAQVVRMDSSCTEKLKSIGQKEFELENLQADLRQATMEWQKTRTFAELNSAEMIMLGGK